MRRQHREDIARMTNPWAFRETVRAERYQRDGDFKKARDIYEKVLDRKPVKKCLPAAFNYGVLAHQLCEHDVAIYRLRQVVTHAPGLVEAWYNLGTALQESLRCAEAVECFETATALAPDHVPSWINMGNAKMGLGDMEGARQAFDAALAFDPDGWEAMYNQAHYLILTGQWLEGWKRYEARWSIPGFQALNAITVDANRPDCPVPWQGESLQGKRLIVCEEQGWGDTLMCLRYAPQLRALGATVTWALREPLLRLAARSCAPDRVVNLNREALPPGDYVVTTMTLHHRLGVTPESVPLADGYLRAA